MILVADTGALLGAYDRAHVLQKDLQRALAEAGLVVIAPMVLTELDHMLRKGVKERSGGRRPHDVRRLGAEASRRLLDWILAQVALTRFVIPAVDENILRSASAVMARYADLAVDLTDATCVALAEEYRTDCVLTIDERDFRAMRPLTAHHSFRLLPFDL
ncbi:type II toxin-antitoxin system VapC family toxin [Streptomyces sp. NPDC056244]|uniref:type II toxin-antitoxin system VapC family toxin n=1 Tax=unclassified Streptomyces TaxID=2593676 RepID=UPI0035D9774C